MKVLIDIGKPRAWQDETWTFAKGTGKRKDWQDEDIRSCSMKSANSGDRYIVCHAGGRDGFIPNASLFLRSCKNPKPTDDYHGDMNWDNFIKWIDEQLVPNLPEPSAIIVDNASYHSKQLHLWLEKHKIPFDSTGTRKELLLLCKANKQPVRYELDEYVASKTPHEIVRLPPYHCQYNLIEMIWSLVKRYFDTHVGRDNDFSEANTRKIWAEALVSITPEQWRTCCEHAERRILEDYAREVGDDIEPSYEIHIPCPNEDFIDDEDLEVMEFLEED
ncbi:uncharacterized protein LOC107042702 [Diachasma alloeum]|uniref:uncharacterized protein LOC107042702 n=1 Tax=Diachasma alloeum TaxID=454923 RepID=UPI0010FB24D4|nr:uncharacterized protein LOC107042702 [Diachasma alloeum]